MADAEPLEIGEDFDGGVEIHVAAKLQPVGGDRGLHRRGLSPAMRSVTSLKSGKSASSSSDTFILRPQLG